MEMGWCSLETWFKSQHHGPQQGCHFYLHQSLMSNPQDGFGCYNAAAIYLNARTCLDQILQSPQDGKYVRSPRQILDKK